MFIANNGDTAISFTEESVNSNGTKTKAMRDPSELTLRRARAESTIVNMARQSGEKVGVLVSRLVKGSIPELQQYVQARGEAPASNPIKLAVQAALLRSIEIATVAKALDTVDADAMEVIEKAEGDAFAMDDPDANKILSPDVAAAIALMLYRIVSRYKRNGGSGSLVDFANDLRRDKGADSFDGVCCADYATGSQYNLPKFEDETPAPTGGGGGGSWLDDIFDHIDTVVDGIGKVKDVIGSASQQTGGIIDQIKNIGSDIGADSFSKYMAANWWKILAGVVAAVIIIILFARAVRK